MYSAVYVVRTCSTFIHQLKLHDFSLVSRVDEMRYDVMRLFLLSLSSWQTPHNVRPAHTSQKYTKDLFRMTQTHKSWRKPCDRNSSVRARHVFELDYKLWWQNAVCKTSKSVGHNIIRHNFNLNFFVVEISYIGTTSQMSYTYTRIIMKCMKCVRFRC